MSQTTSRSKLTRTSEACSKKRTDSQEESEGKTVAETTATAKSGGSKTSKKLKDSRFMKSRNYWNAYIRKHREDLRNAQPKVDDRPPRLNISTLYDPEMLKTQQKSILSTFNLNPEIVKMIHEINVFGGRTGTFSHDYNRLVPSSNFAGRKCEALKTEKANQQMKQMIRATGPRLPKVKDYAKFWKKMEDLIEFTSDFPLFWKVKKKKKEKIQVGPSKTYFKQYVTEKSAKYPDKRPRVFFEITIRNVGAIGKMVAVLFSDYVPMTVKNFLAFCDPKAELTYKGCRFYLIFQNFFCQTGDVVENRGFGGTSIYGPYFGDEDHTLQHGERGILTMFNKIPNRNQCQFLLTFRELKSLNGTNVVFGKIIKGFHVLDAIESVGTKMTGRPKVDIYISDCDEI